MKYFNCARTKSVFGCNLNENAYNCLSCHIDLFEDVMKNNSPISVIINKK